MTPKVLRNIKVYVPPPAGYKTEGNGDIILTRDQYREMFFRLWPNPTPGVEPRYVGIYHQGRWYRI